MAATETPDIEESPSDKLINHVQEDSHAEAFEKQFSVYFSREDDRITVYSGISTGISTLLEHKEFEPNWIAVADGRSHYQANSRQEALSLVQNSDASITGIDGTLPLGALKIKNKPRQSNDLWQVFN